MNSRHGRMVTAVNLFLAVLVIAGMTLLVAIYDLWILGGAAAKINRLTDEYKAIS